MAQKTYTTEQIAKVLDTDPKNLRYFLRKQNILHPGKGGRYGFTRDQARNIISRYRQWHSARESTVTAA
jgi:phage antirepressor YoqD-like protein